MNPNELPQIKCKVCGKIKSHHAKGMCFNCYLRQHKGKEIVCKECGKTKPHKAFGLCKACHMHYLRNKNK
jgi:NMD protein affecting ribosome stability and mRNA decay